MLRKSYPVASFKALTDDAGQLTGEFEAVVSVFGNVDRVGDRVQKGAFKKSLDSWKSSGDPIPVLWSHDWINPDSHIGTVQTADETDKGLSVKGILDIDSNTRAAAVAKLLAERRVKEWSFSYEVVKEKKARDGANDLIELEIIEVGPTLKGMNPATETLTAKAYIALAGSVEQRQDVLRNAVDAWTAETYPSTDDGELIETWASIDGTFDDYVVFTVRIYGEEPATVSYRAGYTVAEDGTVILGEPLEVEIEAVVSEKAIGLKAGRVLSKKNETDLRQASELISGVLAQMSDSADDEAAEADGKAKAEADGKADTPLSPLSAQLEAALIDDTEF